MTVVKGKEMKCVQRLFLDQHFLHAENRQSNYVSKINIQKNHIASYSFKVKIIALLGNCQ